ncbi:MAG: restriction endonuclease subunit S [bacterium]
MNSPLAAPLSTAHCPLSTLGSPPIPPGYKQTDVGVIPEEWEVSSVGREFEIKLGKMLDSEKNFGVSKPYLGNRAVQWDRIDISDLPNVPMTRADIERFRLRKGDLLVCEGGEVGRAAIWDAPIDECYYQKAIHRLRALRGFDSRLMAALLRLWSERGLLANYVTQTSIAHLPREKFMEIPIPVPPLPEQRAIAEALSDVDALLCGLDRLIAKKRDLKQATMQQLLTPPRAGQAGQTRLPGFKGEWEVKRLGEVGKCLRGVSYQGDSDLSNRDTTRTKRLLRSNNVQDAVVVTEDVQFVNAARVTLLQVLKKDDILICMANGSKALVGKSGLFRVIDGYEYTFGAFMGCFRTNPNETNPSFVFYLFQTGRYRDYINNLLAGSSINNLRPSSIESLEFPIPPLPEQTAIAGVLSDMDTELAALEQRREKTRALKQGMMQELLTGRIRLGAGGEQKGKMRHIEEMGRIKHGAPVSHKARGGAA